MSNSPTRLNAGERGSRSLMELVPKPKNIVEAGGGSKSDTRLLARPATLDSRGSSRNLQLSSSGEMGDEELKKALGDYKVAIDSGKFEVAEELRNRIGSAVLLLGKGAQEREQYVELTRKFEASQNIFFLEDKDLGVRYQLLNEEVTKSLYFGRFGELRGRRSRVRDSTYNLALGEIKEIFSGSNITYTSREYGIGAQALFHLMKLSKDIKKFNERDVSDVVRDCFKRLGEVKKKEDEEDDREVLGLYQLNCMKCLRGVMGFGDNNLGKKELKVDLLGCLEGKFPESIEKELWQEFFQIVRKDERWGDLAFTKKEMVNLKEMLNGLLWAVVSYEDLRFFNKKLKAEFDFEQKELLKADGSELLNFLTLNTLLSDEDLEVDNEYIKLGLLTFQGYLEKVKSGGMEDARFLAFPGNIVRLLGYLDSTKDGSEDIASLGLFVLNKYARDHLGGLEKAGPKVQSKVELIGTSLIEGLELFLDEQKKSRVNIFEYNELVLGLCEKSEYLKDKGIDLFGQEELERLKRLRVMVGWQMDEMMKNQINS